MLPQVITNYNLFIDGVGYAGVVKNFSPPKLAKKMVEIYNGGTLSSIKVPVGIEPLESTFELTGYVAEVIEKFAVQAPDGVPVRLMAAESPNSADGTVDALEWIMKGSWEEIDWGDVKNDEENTMKVSFPQTSLKYRENNEDILEIDTLNMIYKVKGKDLLSEVRAAIGMNG